MFLDSPVQVIGHTSVVDSMMFIGEYINEKWTLHRKIIVVIGDRFASLAMTCTYVGLLVQDKNCQIGKFDCQKLPNWQVPFFDFYVIINSIYVLLHLLRQI